jgi:hypothetical protein
MRIVIAVLVMLLWIVPNVFAQKLASGHDLIKACGPSTRKPLDSMSKEEIVAGIKCQGYLLGFLESGDFHNFTYKIPTPDRLFCPKPITTLELQKMVVKYLEAHPEELDKQGYFVTTKAFMEAFPCK